ncbi:MAG: gamma-glutamylcyclotransferase family protein [Myxococcota bacterium]|nr:gamma-glutamylcyclotransferase family protein [Myxococcota bacterium]
MEEHVFVYGSLMQGLQFHHVLDGADYLGEDRTEGAYRLISLGPYPAAVEGVESAIRGELYRVNPAILRRLDVLEGAPELYERRRVTLHSGQEAWMYIMPPRSIPGANTCELVPDGDWRAYVS